MTVIDIALVLIASIIVWGLGASVIGAAQELSKVGSWLAHNVRPHSHDS